MDEQRTEAMSNALAHQPPPHLAQSTVNSLRSMEDYHRLYQQSIQSPNEFWSKTATELLRWDKPFTQVMQGDFSCGDVQWFSDGQLNVSVNCIDRHAHRNSDKIAIIWEADEPGNAKHITYGQLLRNVCQLANVLLSLGVRRGDAVAIYMPMIPEAAYAMLACARIGAVHSAVFAGFSAESLRDRILDANCKVLLTADQGKRGGKAINLKQIADTALIDCPGVQKCLVFQRTGAVEVSMHKYRDLWWHEEMQKQRPVCPPLSLNAEDPLFYLYTSGSTGKPKGLMHTQAGYLLGVTLTLKNTFDVRDNDIFGCVADVGWITGHSYIVYGPLSLGVTTVMFESIPTYPDAGRYWSMIDQHKITHFYTAPTAIRALKRFGDDIVGKYDLNSVRVLGTVGEPINPEAWNWYYNVVGRKKCPVIDTFWQTETGSFVLAPYAAVTPAKPGSATLPQFGIVPALLDSTTGNDETGVLCIKSPWPSMARTIFNDHARYLETYFKPYKGFYFTGDGAYRDKDGYYWILGRVDDVINVSGHRISTAEIESALVQHHSCAEAAVIGVNDDITGQAIVAFCTLKSESNLNPIVLQKELIAQIRKSIGPFASPKRIFLVTDLPKTRSGKIMRRILRKIASNEVDQLGDTSTLADPAVIDHLIQAVKGT